MSADSVMVACPSCGFTRAIPSGNLPPKPVRASCSKCSASFLFDSHLQSEPVSAQPAAPRSEPVTCPKCGYRRTENDAIVDPELCPRCHIVYSKWVPPVAAPGYRPSSRPVELETLLYPRERTLFQIELLFSVLYWGALLLVTKGSILFLLPILFLGHLLAQSALISHLKGNGIKLSSRQFPELYQQHLQCCRKLGFDETPEAYLVNGSGFLNAFASRFLGRNFVVLYSNVINALADQPDAINFYIGHELGHIKRKHLVWGPVIWPGSLVPLVGAAYSRAREYSCDQFGRACCETPESAVRGLVALSAGEKLWQGVNIGAYLQQADQSQGFWMSLHELVSDYPWTVKRVCRVHNPLAVPPGRSKLAWFFALFCPRIGMGGSPATVLVTVAIIGILAAVAIPQFQAYRAKAKGMGMSSQARVESGQTTPWHELPSQGGERSDHPLMPPQPPRAGSVTR